MTTVDICFYTVDVPEVGIYRGKYVSCRAAGSKWTSAEQNGPLGVWHSAEIADGDLDMLRSGKRKIKRTGKVNRVHSVVNVDQRYWPKRDLGGGEMVV